MAMIKYLDQIDVVAESVNSVESTIKISNLSQCKSTGRKIKILVWLDSLDLADLEMN